ncbi:MAG TPA: hypothetical protein VMU54_04940 [Planctomycetota bacterium]|nr:hypothetical protein [Planctomycetota bacterium]
MADETALVQVEPLQRGLGYLVDQSHPPLFFAAFVGVGEVLEHSLSQLEEFGRDVSPIVLESRSRTVVINVYEPEPVMVQVVQQDGPLERTTEILGAGIGLGVLREVRRTAAILNLVLTPLTEHFCKRVSNEKTTYVQTYALFRGDPRARQTRFAQVLRGLQDKCRREDTLLRDLL